MAIWSSEIKELEKLYESFKGQLPDLEKELGQLIHFDDPNVIMLYSRRCLEVIITDLCECELKRPRKTEPLKGIIDKLHKEDKVPSHIITSMHGLNELSTYGTHPKDFDPEQVKPVLVNLDIIIKWYLNYKKAGTDIKPKPSYEISPEIQRTKDVNKSIQIPKKRLIGLLSGLILLVVIVVAVLFFTNIIGSGKQTKELDKSIAVLPFFNDSPSDSNQYFINGIMEEVLNNLQKIKDFRVLSRTSTDQYKSKDRPTIPEIAKKLGVSYIVEGSGQKYGNSYRLRVQLIVGNNERHLWAESYEKEIRGTKDIYGTQSEIAQSIASALKATLTPEEKQLINKILTTNLTAYDFYQQGREEYTKWQNGDTTAMRKAEDLYHKSLKYDSKFAPAYSGLARVYWDKHFWKEFFSKNFMDSVLILTKIALSFDDQLSEPYTLRGDYYREIGKPEQAIEEYDKAIKLNPNDWMAYGGKSDLYYTNTDLVNLINSIQRAASINHGPELPALLGGVGWSYFCAGFPEKSKYYYQERLKLDSDSAAYYSSLTWVELWLGNYNKSIEFGRKVYAIDSTNAGILSVLGRNYLYLGQYEESLKYYKKYIEILKTSGQLGIPDMQWIGYAYWQNGYKKDAEYYFDEKIEYCNKGNELKRAWEQSLYTYYDLADVYAFIGEKDKAYKNLRIFNKIQRIPLWSAALIKVDPLFNNIRNEPEFQQIAKDVEAKYQAEHERVRKWLEETGQL